MAEPYLGQIILVGFTFAPLGYAMCDGQLLSIAQNETLFQLIGTTYGGNGQTTFALPDLRGRIPIGTGQGAGLANYGLGEFGGAETSTLVVTQVAPHAHTVDPTLITATARCRNGAGNQLSPVGNVMAIETAGPYTDPALTPGSSLIRAAHVTELRSRIDTRRFQFNLGAFPYSDFALAAGTVVKVAHITDLRSALSAVYAAAVVTPPSYTDPNLAAGIVVKQVHIAELRSALEKAPTGRPTTPAAYSSEAPDANMRTGAGVGAGTATAALSGGNQSHPNAQPYLTMAYCIALTGIFPSQI